MRKLRFLWAALYHRFWGVITAMWGALGAAVEFRDRFISTEWQQWLHLTDFPDLPLSVWLVGFLGIVLWAVVNHASEVTTRLQGNHDLFTLDVDRGRIEHELRLAWGHAIAKLHLELRGRFQNTDVVPHIVTGVRFDVLRSNWFGRHKVIASESAVVFGEKTRWDFGPGVPVDARSIGPYGKFVMSAILPDAKPLRRHDVVEVHVSVMGRADTVWCAPAPRVVEQENLALG